MNKSVHGDSYEDDGILFESVDINDSRLAVRVGPVFSGDISHPEKAIWIELDNKEFLMSHETFISLTGYIHRRFDEWKRFIDLLNEEKIRINERFKKMYPNGINIQIVEAERDE